MPDPALDLSAFEHSPIIGIHLWFDRPVMELPSATLLDRAIQWAFKKGEGRYVQLVVSASRSLVEMGRQEVIDLAVRELGSSFRGREAVLVKAHGGRRQQQLPRRRSHHQSRGKTGAVRGGGRNSDPG